MRYSPSRFNCVVQSSIVVEVWPAFVPPGYSSQQLNNQTRVWADWLVLFQELGRRAALSDGVVGAEEVEEVSRVVKRLCDHISLMSECPA